MSSTSSAGRGGKLTEDQRDALRSINVVAYAGLLTAEEYGQVADFASSGLIRRSYSGAGGLMGLAKLELTEAGRQALTAVEE